MNLLSDDIHDLLVRELRAAVQARLSAGADPRDVLADLDQRLESLREMRRRTALRRGRRPPP